MKKVVLLLFIVVVSVVNAFAQKTKNEYHESMTNKVLVRTTKAQVIKEVENFFKAEKRAIFSDIRIREDDGAMGDKMFIISFKMELVKGKYKLDCFPLPQYGKEDSDENWVEVSMDTTKFYVENGCSIDLMNLEFEGYQQTMVTIHFNAYTSNIETQSTNKLVFCRLSELTADLKTHLATKFKKK